MAVRVQGRVLHPDTQKAIRAEQEAAVTTGKVLNATT